MRTLSRRETSFAKGEADPSVQTEVGGPRGGAPAGKRAVFGAMKDACMASDGTAAKVWRMPTEGATASAAWQ